MSESYLDLSKIKNSKKLNRSQSSNDIELASTMRKKSEEFKQDQSFQFNADSGNSDYQVGMPIENSHSGSMRRVRTSSSELAGISSPEWSPGLASNSDSPAGGQKVDPNLIPQLGHVEVEEVDYHKFYKFYNYFLSIYNIIDLLAIVPFYIELTGVGINLSFIRVLRLARVMRVFKLGKNMSGFVAVTKTIKSSFQALGVVGFFILLSVLLFGCVEYFIEGGTYMVTAEFPNGAYLRKGDGGHYEVSTFTSIPASLYWAVVTAVTVGYGDITPTSAPGKIVAICCMYLGVLMMALPITVIGNNFNREYESLVGNDLQHTIFETLQKLLIKYDDEIRQMACRNKNIIEEPRKYAEKTALLLSIANCLDDVKRQKLQVSLEKMMELKRLHYLEQHNSPEDPYFTMSNAFLLEKELTDLFETTEFISQSNPFLKSTDSNDQFKTPKKSQSKDLLNTNMKTNSVFSASSTTPTFAKESSTLSQASKQNQSDSNNKTLSPKSPGKWDFPE